LRSLSAISILADAKSRDISESDTVNIVRDMLGDVLGYNKFIDVTSEFAIRGTFVDLAVKVGEEVRFLIEGKAIGVDLKDAHVKQAIDYGANHGIEWIVLSNAVAWRVYKIHFRQPIDKSLIFDFDLLQSSPRTPDVLDCFGSLSREGFTKSSMTALFQQKQATSKFSIAAILLSEPMITALRRELRRLFPGIKVEDDVLATSLAQHVLKREVVDSDEAKQAVGVLKKAMRSGAQQAERAR
jgi:hypothetical protein